MCRKWRALPEGTDPDELPERWECAFNVYDPEHMDCDAPEETSAPLQAKEPSKAEGAKTTRGKEQNQRTPPEDVVPIPFPLLGIDKRVWVECYKVQKVARIT